MSDHAAELKARVMRAVIDAVGRDNLVVKGGAALVFGYGINRYTKDLDFDVSRPVRDLEKKLERIDIPNVVITSIDVLKNTDTTKRYRFNYVADGNLDEFKVEISQREFVNETDVTVVDGVRITALSKLADQKLRAAFDGELTRVAARDLYDIHFLATQHAEAFDIDLADRLRDFAANPESIFQRYAPAFKRDEIDADLSDVETLALELHDHSQEILRALKSRKPDEVALRLNTRELSGR